MHELMVTGWTSKVDGTKQHVPSDKIIIVRDTQSFWSCGKKWIDKILLNMFITIEWH